MKTRKELNELKKEVESMNMKLAELTDDELNEIVGGMKIITDDDSDTSWWQTILNLFFKIRS